MRRSRTATGCTDHRAGRSGASRARSTELSREGDRIRVGSARSRGLGHPGAHRRPYRLLFRDERMIFVGDTMFAMGCGRLVRRNAAADVRESAAACRRFPTTSESIAGMNIRSPTRASRLTPSLAMRRGRAPGSRSRQLAIRREDHAADDGRRGTRDQPLRSCSGCRNLRPPAERKRQLPLIISGRFSVGSRNAFRKEVCTCALVFFCRRRAVVGLRARRRPVAANR